MKKSLKEELKLDLSGDLKDGVRQGDKDLTTNRSTKSSVKDKQPSSPNQSSVKENPEKISKLTGDSSVEKKSARTTWRDPLPLILNKGPPYSFPAFGTAGGGCPNFDKDGNRIAIIPGPSTIMRDEEEERKKGVAARLYSKELEQAILVRELHKIKERQMQRSEPNETFVDKMQQAHTGKPRRNPHTGRLVDQHLNSTDVTNLCNISPRHYYSYGQQLKAPLSYSTELERQAEGRKLRAVLESHRDRKEAQQHFDVFNKTFGSTLPDTLRKQNLTQLLYDPDFNKNEFKKPVTHQVPYLPSNTNFVKNNIGAHHENRFEVPEAPPYPPSKNYYLHAPYAHHFQ